MVLLPQQGFAGLCCLSLCMADAAALATLALGNGFGVAWQCQQLLAWYFALEQTHRMVCVGKGVKVHLISPLPSVIITFR